MEMNQEDVCHRFIANDAIQKRITDSCCLRQVFESKYVHSHHSSLIVVRRNVLV
jgi:hypothetical protein